MKQSAPDFVTKNTTLTQLPFVPELSLYLSDQITPIWQATETFYDIVNPPPPFWAFAWPGGLALARLMLDQPQWVKNKRVLDFASGSGLAAIAAAKAGALNAQAVDIDPLAKVATQLNAARNRVLVENRREVDLTQPVKDVNVIMAGDVCYEQAMSIHVLRWLNMNAKSGTTVLLADPDRAYAPKANDPDLGLKEVAVYDVPVLKELEDRDTRRVTIWQFSCGVL